MLSVMGCGAINTEPPPRTVTHECNLVNCQVHLSSGSLQNLPTSFAEMHFDDPANITYCATKCRHDAGNQLFPGAYETAEQQLLLALLGHHQVPSREAFAGSAGSVYRQVGRVLQALTLPQNAHGLL